MKDWRKMLEDIGGYKNELTAVPASAVKEMILDIELMRSQLNDTETIIGSDTSGAYSNGYKNAYFLQEATITKMRAEHQELKDVLVDIQESIASVRTTIES